MGLGCRFQGFRVLVERGWACFRAVLFMNVQATTRFRVFGSALALRLILLMDKILHDPKDPKLWELWYIPYNE